MIGGRATFCPVHRSERNAWTNRNPSTRSITFTPTDVAALHELDAKIDNLVRLIGDATIGYQSLGDPPAWLNPLMIATKETVQAWRDVTDGKLTG